MRPFRLGKRVWEQATVTKRHDERSYEVETEKGTYRRNRADLREQSTKQVQQTSEQTPSDTETWIRHWNMNQEKIQAGANSTQEAPVQLGANQQVVHAPVAQRPKRTVREPAYLKDYLH